MMQRSYLPGRMLVSSRIRIDVVELSPGTAQNKEVIWKDALKEYELFVHDG